MELHSPRFDPYSSIQKLVDELEEKGYKEKFEVISSDEMKDSKGNTYSAEDLVINETHRLTQKKTEIEKTVVYALVSKSGVKGVVVDHYGEDSDDTINEFLMNVERHDALEK